MSICFSKLFTSSPLVLVVTGTICYKAFQEHYTNHNTAGMISILKQALVMAHSQYHPVLVWMDVVSTLVVAHPTLSSQVAEVVHHTVTQVVVGVVGVLADSLKLLIGNKGIINYG